VASPILARIRLSSRCAVSPSYPLFWVTHGLAHGYARLPVRQRGQRVKTTKMTRPQPSRGTASVVCDLIDAAVMLPW
jgi:hypothetical protein